MTLSALLHEIADRGASIEVRGDKLRITPASAIPPELAARLRENKAAIIALWAGGFGSIEPVSPFAATAGGPDGRMHKGRDDLAPAGRVTIPAPVAGITPAVDVGDVADVAERWAERASIMEYDGGLRRDVAEREAALDVLRRCKVEGLIPAGWLPESWTHELRRRADIIADPVRAEQFRSAADRIEQVSGGFS